MEFLNYFQSYEDYFWEWENKILSEDSVFETITIPNGQTIGYEKFVFEILEYLSDDSIPPFGTLLLAIVATNTENEQAIEMIHDLVKSKNIVTAFPQSQSFRMGASIDFLKILSSLPNEYKVGEKRMKLFQTIFHECHNRVSSEKAKNLLDEYKDYRGHLLKTAEKTPFNEANFRKDFRTLALLKTKFPTLQSILNAMEIVPHDDLNDTLDEEILEEKNLSDTITDFVDQLIEEDKTFHVGNLIKRLWSGLNIPLHHNHPSEQPLGGISDLTNKGDFDKLVISEFAYDDDVFMSRIANNEALYIQREVPPEADKIRRILLIDTTLKNWGNPKILAFASAIAIARHPKTDIECQVYVVGEDYKEIAVENVNEVIKSLNELSSKLDCSTGLDSFFAANKINSKNQEVFLFSSEESLKLAPMQNAMSTYFNDIKYVFAIGLQDINVFKNQNKGKKLLQHIIMPLEELWQKDNTNKKQRVKEIRDESMPLLYPVERCYQNIFTHNNEFYMYINGNLFMFSNDRFGKGFVKIASNLPFRNGNFAMKINNKGEKILWYHYYDLVHYASTINLSTKELKSYKDFNQKINDAPLKVFEYNNNFYFAGGVMHLLPDFWQIDGDFHCTQIRNESIRKAFSNNLEENSSFINNYKNSRVKYSVIKKVESVVIYDNFLMINGYGIENLELRKEHRFSYRQLEKLSIKFEEKVNLILKNKGTSPLAVVQIIKTNTDKTLKEANEIIDGQFGVVLNSVTRDAAEKLKKEIENNGAVCYIEIQYFQSGDGSKITNQDGILVFESSDTRIDKFYIPFVINMRTIMATEGEYAGNNYFIPGYTKESVADDIFIEKYFKPFILNIVHHGA
ncbi:ribosomal protein L7/L12 [Flavobacterium sp. ALJ2]|uniref:ribosomal protein L7/L12 n=1 Tax=Flavobacterium sp. ALJ2 TaxID=2786960 RepID=UPI00189F01C2|nr:ribosomal protein L7/L12 [Flavobacterium sp. ALJ2]MBF7090777.1 ribosomal protein L7/L12 [Flavobacterium sp. ALJ2]